MSECQLVRCQQERKFLRREFNKWTKNLLLQIGLETISKNYLHCEITSFEQNDDKPRIPDDFNPDQACLFCVNREEYLPKKHPHIIEIEDENSPLDLSLKSTTNSNSRLTYGMEGDLLPTFNSDVFFPSNYMNFDYLSHSFAHANLFPSLSMDHYGSNTSFTDHYVTQLAKQMAYLRMIQEIQNQEKINNDTNHSLDTSSVLTESLHVNQIMTDIMTRTLHEIYEEQIKQSRRISKQGELLYVKKPANEHSDTSISKNNSQSKHRKEIAPSTSNSSPSISHKSKSNSSTHVHSRRQKESITNSKGSISNDGKQTRPKRGQYRRYESEQLAKAVTAVLTNEMSVHKAGSYFGVPHSTLEYKVKERYSKSSSVKTKTNHSSSDAFLTVNSTSDEMTPNDSMDYDNIDENNKLSSSNHEKDLHDQFLSINIIPSEQT